MPRPRTLPMVNLGSETGNVCSWGYYLGLRSRLSMMVVCWYPRFGIHDSILVVPQQQSANEPTGGIRAGSLSLGTPPPPRCWWFVVCGTLMRHPRNGCLSFGRYEPSDVRAFRRFLREWRRVRHARPVPSRIALGACVFSAYPRGGGLTANSDEMCLTNKHYWCFIF